MFPFIDKQLERLSYLNLRVSILFYKMLSALRSYFIFLNGTHTKKYDIGLYPFAPKGSDGYTRRFQEYFQYLEKDNFSYMVFDICTNDECLGSIQGSLIKKYQFYKKVIRIRYKQTLQIRHCKSAFIHRNLFPFYPDLKTPFLEKLAYKLCDNIIIDYWDSVWVYNPVLIDKTVKYCHRLSVVNDFIKQHFSNEKAIKTLFPIGVNLDKYVVKKDYNLKQENSLTLFYTGQPTNVKKMFSVLDNVFNVVSKKINIRLILVSREKVSHPKVQVEHHLFDEKSFFSLLTQADAGIFAIEDSEIARGKMAMKALDYMSAGLPCIASPYGVTPYAQNNKHLLFATNDNEWIEKITVIFNDYNLRKTIGQAGRKMMEEHHTLEASYKILKEMIV